MKSVDVELGARSYQVRIGRGLLSMPQELVPWVRGAQVCVVTDETVASLYLEPVLAALAGKQVLTHILPPGEPSKTLGMAEAVFDRLLGVPCDREVTIIALGGGVVGDLAGFVAACYQRGVPYLQLPTTLLAQVDSSVGGKTGVNHPLGKNMIGAFHQPHRVLADTAAIDTLPRRQLAAGLAEVIKVGAINDIKLFTWLEEHLASVMARQPEALAFVVQRACANKAAIVARDEREGGVRALLNLGHTFGHAIEAGLGYGQWLHGEAVATGMAMAARMSMRLGWLAAEEGARLEGLLSAAGLPVGPFTGLSASAMLGLMRADKKVRAGNLRLVLLRGIGQAVLTSDYPMQALTETLEAFTDGGSGL